MDLPQIAVVGSQSVGKSSLIESISGVSIYTMASGRTLKFDRLPFREPREHVQGNSAQTLYSISEAESRCPIECRLSRVEADWSCGVYLRVSRETHEIQFGSPITDKSEIEERIRRAQSAILNPSRQALDFLNQSPPNQNEVSFSKDLISVRISGRNVDDLSFVDLPGRQPKISLL